MSLQTALAALAATIVLVACGGGGGTREPPVPEATDVGQPIGPATSAVIGNAGGTLSSADGSVSVEVPAGASARDERSRCRRSAT